MFFDGYRRRRRETLIREEQARTGVVQNSILSDNVATIDDNTDNTPSINIGNNGSPGETTSMNTWRQRRGGPDAGANAAPQVNSVTNEDVILSREEAAIRRRQNNPFVKMKIGFLKYLLLMVRVYKGLFRDVQNKFNRHTTFWTGLITGLTVFVLALSAFSVVGWIVSVFIQWGFGDSTEFRSMLISLAILHTPLFNKQYYLSRV